MPGHDPEPIKRDRAALSTIGALLGAGAGLAMENRDLAVNVSPELAIARRLLYGTGGATIGAGLANLTHRISSYPDATEKQASGSTDEGDSVMSLEWRVLEKLASCFDEEDLQEIIYQSELEEEAEKIAVKLEESRAGGMRGLMDSPSRASAPAAAGSESPLWSRLGFGSAEALASAIRRKPGTQERLMKAGLWDEALNSIQGLKGHRAGPDPAGARESRQATADWLPGRKKQGSAISEEEAMMLAEYLGPEKVAAVLQAAEEEDEMEKAAEQEVSYHYQLGEVMAQGFQDFMDKVAAEEQQIEDYIESVIESDEFDEDEKVAMLAPVMSLAKSTSRLGTTVPLLGKAVGRMGGHLMSGNLRGAEAAAGTVGKATKLVGRGMALPAAGVAAGGLAGYALGRRKKKEKELKIKISSDAEIYRALAVLDEAGLLEDMDKVAVAESPAERRRQKAKHDKYRKHMKEEEEDEEEEEKNSSDAEIYQALATLSEAGLLKESSQKDKGLPDHLKKHKYPPDRDGDGKVNEPSIVEKKSSDQEIYEAIDLLHRAGLISE
jgi:Fe2+ or Zn2+ uptake regulation protein